MPAASASAHELKSYPRFVRVAGRDPSLALVLAEAAQADLPVKFLAQADRQAADDALIDPALTTAPGSFTDPAPGTTYAGLTPAQRHAYLAWIQQPAPPAPLAFVQLYIAGLEVQLLEGGAQHAAALRQLLHLSFAFEGRGQVWASRGVLFGHWLAQDGAGIAAWLARGHVPPSLTGVALGLQAMLGESLTAQQLGVLLNAWHNQDARLAGDLLKLRLASLTSTLGTEPLAYALAQLDDDARAAQPWRCAHRGLRVALPQPDLRPYLEALLADLMVVAEVNDLDAPQAITASEPEATTWRLILEFGHSRSEYFPAILARCQRLPGYAQLMDEDRKLVYRVTFTRSELRRFWQIWDYVHGWSTARVYLNGEELEKWKVWPYSQYLR